MKFWLLKRIKKYRNFRKESYSGLGKDNGEYTHLETDKIESVAVEKDLSEDEREKAEDVQLNYKIEHFAAPYSIANFYKRMRDRKKD